MCTWSCVHIWVCTNENIVKRLRHAPTGVPCVNGAIVFLTGKMESVPWKWAVIFKTWKHICFHYLFPVEIYSYFPFCFVPSSIRIWLSFWPVNPFHLCLSVHTFLLLSISFFFVCFLSLSFVLSISFFFLSLALHTILHLIQPKLCLTLEYKDFIPELLSRV